MVKSDFVSRRQSREEAFALLFEKCYNDSPFEELIKNAEESREIVISDFAKELINGVENNLTEIDSVVSESLKGWSLNRISKVTLSILRIAIYEILKCENIPNSVSINEAVEIAKIYSTDKDASFINGVLGSVVKREKK
ncbi:MAG: transcription antitermination factor NusB [Clostridiales bacterium]|nr:transcription antitermination factor NusB [Clostridiales bacterium]